MWRLLVLMGFASLCTGLTGCGTHVNAFNEAAPKDGETVAEGTIFSVKYDLGDGKIGGFTRLDNAHAVPGGNGSWNVDAQGRLTSRFLIITYPYREKELGPQVIPVERLYDVQFGNGGIARVRNTVSLDRLNQPHDHGDHEAHH
jgi:hypothetical protein